MGVCEKESKAKVLQHFKIYPVLKIDVTLYSSLDLCGRGSNFVPSFVLNDNTETQKYRSI